MVTTELPTPDIEQRITDGTSLVQALVADVAARVPRHVRRDDLVSAGMLGLARAATRWDPSRGVAFEAYARTRIKGAILDELRSKDWATRSVRRQTREREAAVRTFVNEHGHLPSASELASTLGVDVTEMQRLDLDLARAEVRSLDAIVDEGGPVPVGPDVPSEAVVDNELKEVLGSAIEALPERLRTVVVSYFFDERPMQEIADELGVTESRISQMRAEALLLLRDGINSKLEPELVGDLGNRRGRVGQRKNAYYDAIDEVHSARGRRLARTA